MKLMTLITMFLISLFVLAEEYTKLDLTQDAITWTTEYDELYSYIPGLEEGLFQEFTLKPSRGPKWKEDAIDVADYYVDFHERSSYWGERYDEEDCPNFTEEDLEEAWEDYGFDWYAVKPLEGSTKTVMYIANYYTILNNPYGKECKIFEDEIIFLNKIVDGKPVYLGIRKDNPPKF